MTDKITALIPDIDTLKAFYADIDICNVKLNEHEKKIQDLDNRSQRNRELCVDFFKEVRSMIETLESRFLKVCELYDKEFEEHKTEMMMLKVETISALEGRLEGLSDVIQLINKDIEGLKRGIISQRSQKTT